MRAIRRSCSLALLAETVEAGANNHDVSDLIECNESCDEHAWFIFGDY